MRESVIMKMIKSKSTISTPVGDHDQLETEVKDTKTASTQ